MCERRNLLRHRHRPHLANSKIAMDSASSPSSSSSSSSSSSPSSCSFQQTYLRTLLPALSRILLHGSFPSLRHRCRATKFAVDMSLALSAGGNLRWQKALAEELMIACEGTKSFRRIRRRKRRRGSARGGGGGKKEDFSEEEEAEEEDWTSRGRRRRRRKWKKLSQPAAAAAAGSGEEEEEEEEEEASTAQQMRSLGGLIPGGRQMDIPLLLEETANYVVSLQLQVQALESLASIDLISSARSSYNPTAL